MDRAILAVSLLTIVSGFLSQLGETVEARNLICPEESTLMDIATI